MCLKQFLGVENQLLGARQEPLKISFWHSKAGFVSQKSFVGNEVILKTEKLPIFFLPAVQAQRHGLVKGRVVLVLDVFVGTFWSPKPKPPKHNGPLFFQ